MDHMMTLPSANNLAAHIVAAGLPPLVAMVLDQYGSPAGQKIAAIAEESVLKARATLIPIAEYYRLYLGKSWF